MKSNTQNDRYKYNMLILRWSDIGWSRDNNVNLVVTILSHLPLSDSERSILAKGLKFVPNPGSLDIYSVKQDTESFFRRLRLKAFFHNKTSVPKDVFEVINT